MLTHFAALPWMAADAAAAAAAAAAAVPASCSCMPPVLPAHLLHRPQVDKIRRLKQMCLEKGCNPWIEVDGGVTPENAYKVRQQSS